jgi:hypothetical protein
MCERRCALRARLIAPIAHRSPAPATGGSDADRYDHHERLSSMFVWVTSLCAVGGLYPYKSATF